MVEELVSPGVDFNLPTTPVTSAAIFTRPSDPAAPALNAYPPNASLPPGAPACPGLDQRRQLRPGGTECDLGAIEVGAVAELDPAASR